MNYDVVYSNIRLPINQSFHGIKSKQSVIKSASSTISIDGETKDGLSFGTREYTIGARAGVGSDELDKEIEGVKTMGGGE